MRPVEGSIRVLLVDEDEDYLLLTKRIMAKVTEFEVETALDAEEALRIMGEAPVDAVVSDYQMPRINGLELLRMVRERHGDLPFIILTGRSREEVAIAALNLGADFYLQKGFDQLQLTELANMVRQAVTRRRAEHALQESESLQRLILDSSPIAIGVVINGLFVYVNRVMAESLCYDSPEELVETDPLLYVHPDDRGEIRELQRAMRRGEKLEEVFSFRALTRMGEARTVEATTYNTMWLGESAVLLFARDVTEERLAQARLAESRERLRALHRYAAVISRQGSEDDAVRTVHEALTECLGYRVIDIIRVEGDVLRDVYPERDLFVTPLNGKGITARAAVTGETQLVSDTSLNPDYITGRRGCVRRSELAVPVKVDGAVEYLLNVEREESGALTEEDRSLVEILAMHMSSALRSLREQERRSSYARRLEALHRHAMTAAGAESLDRLAELTLDALRSILDFEFCDFSVVDGEVIRIEHSSAAGDLSSLPLSGPGIVVRAVNEGTTQYVPDVRLDPDYVYGGKRDASGSPCNTLSELAVPVMVGGVVWAALNIERAVVGGFSEEDRRLAEILAMHAASALQNISALDRLRRHEEMLKALNRFGAEVEACTSVGEIAALTMGAARSIFNYTTGSFGVVEGGVIRFVELMGPTVTPVIQLDRVGITARAARTGETQLVLDVGLDPDYLNGRVEGEMTLSELDVPVLVDGAAVALINLESDQVGAFDETAADMVEIMAEHVASALRSIRSAGERRRYEERLEALSRAMASMNSVESLGELVDQALTIIDEVIAAPYSAYMAVDGGELVTLRTRGSPLLGIRLPLDGGSVTARAARGGRPVLVSDTRVEPGFVRGSEDSLSEMAAPVVAGGRVVGVLNMESIEVDYFDASHVSLAEALAAHVASNLERLWREERVWEAQQRAIEERERAEQAKMLEEMKTSFIRTATHEIRTPLTSIKGYAELAATLVDQGDPTLVSYFEAIMRNTDRLEKLTANLLDVQRIESGRVELELELLDVGGLISEAAAEVEPILRRRGQRLVVSGGGGLVTGDRDRLMQVVVNLAVNASRFSPEDSEIMIKVETAGGSVRVSVHDHGVGIREEDMPRLFKPFPGIRVDGVSGGTGLGLSICKGVVELHGGRIWAESGGPGLGSVFSFTLPRREDEAHE